MLKHAMLLMFTALIFISSCSTGKMENKERLITQDGVKIAYTYLPSGGEKGIILLHMLRRDRNDWNDFAKKLQEGYNIITIDFRGHGQSDGKWEEFSEEDFNNMVLDVKAAKDFLKEKEVTSISIIGASIGANIALNYAGSGEEVKTIILLSPGLDYRGVKTEESILKFSNPILIVVSEEDNYSFESAENLNELAIGTKLLKIYQNAGHGTQMFSDTDLADLIMEWLEKHS